MMHRNVLTVEMGPERYVFKWNDADGAEVIRTAARYAADPELSFTWDHAAAVARCVDKEFGPLGIKILKAAAGAVFMPYSTAEFGSSNYEDLRLAGNPSVAGKSPLAGMCRAIAGQVARAIARRVAGLFGIGRPHPRSEGARRGHRD